MIRRLIILLLIVGCGTEPEDCAGVAGGTAELDNCGVCDTDKTNDCMPDCAGVAGGDAVEDNCGTCDSDNTNDCQFYDLFIELDSDIYGMLSFDITGVTLLGIEPVSGFDIKYNEISENHYRALIFSMQGLALPAHLTIIFSGLIENLCIKDIILADSQGNVLDINDICD